MIDFKIPYEVYSKDKEKRGEHMKISEDNFIKELKNKNEDALYYVIDNYGYIIKSVVSKHLFKLRDYEEECINDCLLGIWNNIQYFNPERSSFKNWVAGIAKYKSIDYLRKYLKDTENLNIDDVFLQSRKDTLDQLIELEEKEEIIKSINSLNNRDQQIFKMLYIDGLSINEISNKINIKVSNIYNILSRGRKKLSRSLKED